MTRAVLLAAGQGTRLRPLTDQRPKGLVPILGASLIERQLGVLASAGIDDVSVVVGHAAQAFAGVPVPTILNPRYAQTNMVISLACARGRFDGRQDVVVAYGDIVYEPRVLQALLASTAPVAVVVDTGWESLWRLRMDDPLADAESLRMADDGRLIELGRRPGGLDEIEAQYIGLFKVSAAAAGDFFARMDALAPGELIEGRPLETAYMTGYLQRLIDDGLTVAAVPVRHGWLEVDSVEDLARYTRAAADGRLQALVDLSVCAPRP